MGLIQLKAFHLCLASFLGTEMPHSSHIRAMEKKLWQVISLWKKKVSFSVLFSIEPDSPSKVDHYHYSPRNGPLSVHLLVIFTKLASTQSACPDTSKLKSNINQGWINVGDYCDHKIRTRSALPDDLIMHATATSSAYDYWKVHSQTTKHVSPLFSQREGCYNLQNNS